jgi:hypothetical protein
MSVDSKRSPGFSFAAASRAFVISQTGIAHQQRGGSYPLKLAVEANGARRTREKATALPMLCPAATSGAGADGDDAAVAVSVRLALPAAEAQTRTSSRSDVVEAQILPWSQHLVETQDIPFGAIVELERLDPNLFECDVEADTAINPKVGLSPMMLERNKFTQELRRSKGATLTDDEMKAGYVAFGKRWEKNQDQIAFKEAYELWQSRPPPSASDKLVTYQCVWGGGSSSSPLCADELCEHIKDHGWPTKEEVYSKPEEYIVEGDSRWDADLRELALSEDEDDEVQSPWAIARQAHNVPRRLLLQPEKFDLMHKGLVNVLEFEKLRSDEGNRIFMVRGLVMAPRGGPGGVLRRSFCVCGTTWSPQVFDALGQEFEDAASETVAILPVPFTICMQRR